MKFLSYSLLILFISTATAFASVTINSPQNGESVSSPFTLTAYATACSYQPLSAMGYSFDYGDTTILNGSTSIDTKVSASLGTHTLHVKSWGDQGAVCVADVTITVASVTNDPATNTSIVPTNAVSVSSLQTFSNWQAIHDSGTGGWSSGYMSLAGSPVHNGSSRELVSNYSNHGGERYNMAFGDDTTSTNFMYDGWVYLTSSATQIANLEMDLYQTMANGQTVIFGFQCDGYSSTWDYTENLGTPQAPIDHWVHTGAACNPRSWSRYAWHHIQINYSRNNYGIVTYKYVWLDGVQQSIWATAPSAFALGWSPVLLTNFQIDGLGSSGSSTVYLDDLTVYRW
jgi:hypothetical protein